MSCVCPCCGFLTIDELDGYEICPVCYWEDDPVQSRDPDYEGGANSMSLEEAQSNYLQYGACSKDFLGMVRKPGYDEKA